MKQPLLSSPEVSELSLPTNMIDQFSEKNYSSREMSPSRPSTGRESPQSHGIYEKQKDNADPCNEIVIPESFSSSELSKVKRIL